MKFNNLIKIILFALLVSIFSMVVRNIKSSSFIEDEDTGLIDFFYTDSKKLFSVTFPTKNIMKDSIVNNNLKIYTLSTMFEDGSGFKITYLNSPVDLTEKFEDINYIKLLVKGSVDPNYKLIDVKIVTVEGKQAYYCNMQSEAMMHDYLIGLKDNNLIIADVRYGKQMELILNTNNKDKYLWSLKW